MLDKTTAIFLKVADCGSMNKAALQLYLSPTAVMNEINKMESSLGFPLFTRSNRGLSLTEAGKSLYHDAKYLQIYSDIAISNARQASNPSQVNIRIGTSHLRACEPFLAAWYKRNLQSQQFKITVVPFTDNSLDDIFHSLGKDFDLLGSICDITNWKEYYQFAKLWDCNFTISISKNHPLAAKERLKIEDLEGERVLFILPGTSAIIDSIRLYLKKNYPKIQIVDYLPHYDINIFNRCAQEDILMLSIDMWSQIHPSLKTVPIDWDFTMPYGIMYPMNPSPYVRQFIDTLRIDSFDYRN